MPVCPTPIVLVYIVKANVPVFWIYVDIDVELAVGVARVMVIPVVAWGILINE